MKIARGTTTVAGINFEIFSDFILRGMIAINQTTGGSPGWGRWKRL